MQLTAAAVTPPAEHATRRPAGADAAAADADVMWNMKKCKVFTEFAMLLIVCVVWLGCSEDQSLVRVKFYKDTLLTKEMLSITISDGNSVWRYGPSSSDGSSSWPHGPSPLHSYLGAWSTPEIETRNEGTLLVQYQFKDSNGALVSGGRVALDLRKDWGWGIDIYHTDRNPYRLCMGCFGYGSFPILGSAYLTSDSDSVFVIWGGNSISYPAEY
jgi:hypothetical protein